MKRTCRLWTKEEVDLLNEWIMENPNTNGCNNRELYSLFPGRGKGAIYAKWNETMHKKGFWIPSVKYAPKHKRIGSITNVTVLVDKAYADFNTLKGMVKQLEDENALLKEKLKSIKSMF